MDKGSLLMSQIHPTKRVWLSSDIIRHSNLDEQLSFSIGVSALIAIRPLILVFQWLNSIYTIIVELL